MNILLFIIYSSSRFERTKRAKILCFDWCTGFWKKILIRVLYKYVYLDCRKFVVSHITSDRFFTKKEKKYIKFNVDSVHFYHFAFQTTLGMEYGLKTTFLQLVTQYRMSMDYGYLRLVMFDLSRQSRKNYFCKKNEHDILKSKSLFLK